MRLLSTQKLFFTSYLLFLFFLPTQLGKHFWPSFSFISGLRIDYLSPTLFFTDVLLLIVFGSFLLSNPRIPTVSLRKKHALLLLCFFVFVLTGIVFSKQPMAGVLGLIRLLEMMLFGYLTTQFFIQKNAYAAAMVALGSSLLVQSLLGGAQFLLKGSINGLFYFLGERSFTMVTPGIANASIHGSLILRPYGTLPHPNVLAGFLLIVIMFIMGNWQRVPSRVSRIGAGIVLILGIGALFLSLSRTTLGVFGMLFFGYGAYLLKHAFSKKTMAGVGIAAVVLLSFTLTTPVAERFLSSSFFEEAFLFREDIAIQAVQLMWNYPIFGVGLHNFLYYLPTQLSSYSYFTQVQPVHNIYLLLFAELGIPAGLLVLYGLYTVVRIGLMASPSLWQKTGVGMVLVLLFLGLFDHYLLTIHQGRLLFAFVLGLVFSLPHQHMKRLTHRKRK